MHRERDSGKGDDQAVRINPGLATGYAEDKVAVDSNGNKVVVTNWILSDDEFAQVKDGRRCLKCMEPLDPAFPASCPLCQYEVRDRQTIDMLREHQGTEHFGPTPWSVIEEQDAAQAERDAPGWLRTKSGIVVPERP